MDKRQKVTDKNARYPARNIMSETGYDKHILFPVLLLVGIGIVMVYSASSAVALKKFGSDFFFLRKQALFAVAGISLLVLCRHIPYKFYWHLTYPLLIGSMLLLVVIHIPGVGYKAGGATRWISFAGYTFQPAELARIALIFFLAYSLSKKRENVREFSIGFFPHIFVLAIFSVLLHLQPDFGTILIFGIITWIMMFIAGVPLKYLAAPLILILPLMGYLMIEAPYRLERVLTFYDPWQYAQCSGYQVIHSLMAFGSGGFLGAGIGQGYQKLFYLPESHTDFIFSVIGEELGLLGVICILALYAWVIWRGLSIARKTENVYGSLVASGITLAFALQVCINMGVALGLLPTKGLTLPFISYGGTSLLVNMAAMGVLMNIGSSERI
jgi:cell division protein FtsW